MGHLNMQFSDRVGRRMKLQDLHVLMTVMQAGSMGKAAQRLNITQPAISRSIAELEHALGVRLLDRHRKGVEPTDYGRALLDCGKAVFDDLRQGLKNIEFLADPAAGEVRVGCSTNAAASFASAIIDRLSQRCPRMVFHLVTTQSEVLHRDLYDRKFDLLITRHLAPTYDEQLDFEFLFENSFVVVTGLQSPWVRRRRIELADLVTESWVLPPATGSASVAMDAFRASGLDYPRVTLVTDSLEVRMRLLATGRFLSIVPASSLDFPAMRPALRILPIKLPNARAKLGIVTLKNRALSSAARVFVEHAREISKEK